MGKLKSKIGKENINNFGSKMIIVDYKKYHNISVYFPEYDYVVHNKSFGNFEKGKISCPYEKRTLGLGFLGEGEYKTKENGKFTDNYKSWYNMLYRCYSPKHPQYKEYGDRGVIVDNDWYNFQNYAEWRSNEIKKYKNFGYDGVLEIDKDILFKGNKVYSRNTCSLVPPEINSLFENLSYRKYKNELPIGVRPQNKKYQAFCRARIRGNTYLGTSDTPEGAFILYKIYKENLIKKTADEFKWCLPENVYSAMYNYEININD